MVKRTQAMRRQEVTNRLSVFDHFVGLALRGLRLVFAVLHTSHTVFLQESGPNTS